MKRTLTQALDYASDEYVRWPDVESIIVAEQHIIVASEAFTNIVEANLETLPYVEVRAMLESAVVQALRFGMRTQRALGA